MDDVERVARALCRQCALQYMAADGVDAYIDQYWRDHIDEARAAMAETRRIDAEALLASYEAGTKLRLHEVADWFERRANAP